MWAGDVEYTRWLMQVRFPNRKSSPGTGGVWLLLGQLWEAQRQMQVYGNGCEKCFYFILFGGFVTRQVFCSVVYMCAEECPGRISLLSFLSPTNLGLLGVDEQLRPVVQGVATLGGPIDEEQASNFQLNHSECVCHRRT